jgi:putative DNA primase/helicase
MRMTTKQAARGKWDGILTQLIGEHAVTRKHGPCPICDGKDRYRYDNKRNDGDWFCNVCGVGDGFKLLSDTLGISFAEAARRVDQVVNNVEEKPFKPDIDIDKRRVKLNDLWSKAQEPFVAYNYLVGRGVPSKIVDQVSKDIRGIEKLDLYEGHSWMGEYPAMLALIRNPKGVPISVHRTYLTPDGKEKKIMPVLESITGACVRLGEPNETLVIAEGIETALAAWAITGYPAWATISAHGMAELKSIPLHVKKVVIVGDNDESFTGQAAAFSCAKYMKQRLKVETVVTMPGMLGWDMLDQLQSMKDGEPGTLQRWAP